MGCSSSKRIQPDPTSESSRGIPADVTSNADAAPHAEAPAVVDRVEQSTLEYVASTASAAVEAAQATLDGAPPGITDLLVQGASSAASAASQFTAQNAPGMAAFIGQLCGTAADLLGAIAPAIPFGGVAAAAFGKALEQGEAFAQAMQAARDLRQTIADRRPTIARFAAQASLARDNASLVGHAAQTLRDAVALLSEGLLFWAHEPAQGGVEVLHGPGRPQGAAGRG